MAVPSNDVYVSTTLMIPERGGFLHCPIVMFLTTKFRKALRTLIAPQMARSDPLECDETKRYGSKVIVLKA